MCHVGGHANLGNVACIIEGILVLILPFIRRYVSTSRVKHSQNRAAEPWRAWLRAVM